MKPAPTTGRDHAHKIVFFLWGEFREETMNTVVTPVVLNDGMTLLWPRLFDGAVSLVKNSCRRSIPPEGEKRHRPSSSSPAVCRGERERLPRRYFRFRMGLSPVRIDPGNFPKEFAFGSKGGMPSALRPPSAMCSRMGRENGVLFHCGALLDSHPPSPLQETEIGGSPEGVVSAGYVRSYVGIQ